MDCGAASPFAAKVIRVNVEYDIPPIGRDAEMAALLVATVVANTGNGLELDASSNDTVESNLISGNGANGVAVVGGNGNTIEMNTIGTDAAGALQRANAQNVHLPPAEDVSQ